MSWIVRGWIPPLAACALGGCKMALLDPKGSVGVDERALILLSTAWMLVVVIPVIVMTIAFAWWFRASNARARYMPGWTHSPRLEAVLWGIPSIIVVVLAVTAWRSTHALDPYRPIAAKEPAIPVQVVALNWKWLFIYPEQGIATVNEMAFPVGVPVAFQVTSDTVMNSFFIPRLGSQIYAMSGMKTRLHLVADAEGAYDGISANFSGSGFSGMKFKALAMDRAGFDAWVERVRQAPKHLDPKTYPALATESTNHPVEYFSQASPGLFDGIVAKYGHQ